MKTSGRRPNSPTLAEVARLAGVSRQTAGAVLLGGSTNSRAGRETIRKIREAAEKLNYRPNHAARALKGVKPVQAGILNRVRSDDDPSHTLITRDLAEELNRRGCGISLAMHIEGGRPQPELAEELAISGVDGLLVLDHHLAEDEEKLSRVLELYPDSVFYRGGSHMPRSVKASVDVDRAAAARLAVLGLLARGRKKIGVLATAEQMLGEDHPAYRQCRLAGLAEELKAAGRDFSRRLLAAEEISSPQAAADKTILFAAADRAIDRLAIGGKADAIVTLTVYPAVTVALVQRLIARGFMVPHDVAVITVRDHPVYQALSPSITAVKLHHDRVARPMVKLMSSLLDREEIAEPHLTIEPELMSRDSA